MKPTDAVIRTRIDNDTKIRAGKVLKQMGLSYSDVIRLTLLKIANEQSVSFAVAVPNEKTQNAMSELKRGEGKRAKTVEEVTTSLMKKS